MSLEKTLDSFMSSPDHAFLLLGPWGVGKTFAVNQWEKELAVDKNIKVIPISLFGISTINELTALALESESIRNRILKGISKLNQQVSVGAGGVSVSIPIIGIISSFLKQSYSKDPKMKYLFVLDDIERKDIRLSIPEIFGFVDSLPKENTKVLLIANLNRMDDKEEFIQFKEKVIDEEYYLETPSESAKQQLLRSSFTAEEYTYFKKELGIVNNLRTLISLNKIILAAGDDRPSNPIIRGLIYCLLARGENKYGEEELISRKVEERKSAFEIQRIFQNNNTEIDVHKLADEIRFELEKKTKEQPGYLIENIKFENLMPDVVDEDIPLMINSIYNILNKNDYKDLNTIKFREKLKQFLKYSGPKSIEIFFSANPDADCVNALTEIEKEIKDTQYNPLELLNVYLEIKTQSLPWISQNSNEKKLEKQIEQIIIAPVAENLVQRKESIQKAVSVAFPDSIPNDSSSLIKKIGRKTEEIFLERQEGLIKNGDFNIDSFKEGIAIFDENGENFSQENFDEIMIMQIRKIKNQLSGNITETWGKAHNLFCYLFQSEKKYSTAKEKQCIESLSNNKNLAGKRMLSLKNQYIK
jgi:hypothetical protein